VTRGKSQEVSLWAGAAAFFGSVLAIGAFDILDIEGWAKFFAGLLIGVFTGGAVYSRERLTFARRLKNGEDE
jgi:hypothetical protein